MSKIEVTQKNSKFLKNITSSDVESDDENYEYDITEKHKDIKTYDDNEYYNKTLNIIHNCPLEYVNGKSVTLCEYLEFKHINRLLTELKF